MSRKPTTRKCSVIAEEMIDSIQEEEEALLQDMESGNTRIIKHDVPVYQYILTYEGEFSFSEVYNVPPNGVCHADDLLYLWNPWLLGPLSGDDIGGHSKNLGFRNYFLIPQFH